MATVATTTKWGLTGAFPGFLLLYVGLYSAYGTESAYFPAFLSSHGLPVERVGFVLAAGTVVRIVAGPILGRVADHLGARKWVLAAAAAAAGLVGWSYLLAFGFLPLLGVSMTHAAATASLAPLSDALAVAAAAGPRGFQYGWVRGAGSAAFVVGTLLSGQMVDRIGLWWIIAASNSLFIVMSLLASRVDDVGETRHPADPRDTTLEAFRSLWRIPVYPWLLLVVALVVGSHALNDGFGVINWRAAGLGGGIISVLWSEAVLGEVVVFFLLGPWLLARLGPARAIALAAAAGAVRWTVMAMTVSVLGAISVQMLHGLTFALVHLSAMTIIARHVPARLLATAQTVYGTVSLGIASAALTFGSGYIYGWYGTHAFWAMAALCVAALPLSAMLGSSSSAPDAAVQSR